EENRIYIGWHDRHVRPVTFKRPLSVITLQELGWVVDNVQTWFTPQSCVWMTASHPKAIYTAVCTKTSLKCSLDMRKDSTRHIKIALFRCHECRATLATVKKLAPRKWVLAKAELDHKASCSLYSPEHCTISAPE
ncbi:hypothetical protein ADUPG1_002765, partial [Aduncisulcus paluster]